MRSFIAVGVPPEIAEYDISGISKCAKVSITKPENRHITLAFLGDISPEDAKVTEYCMKSLDLKPFKVTFTGINTFGDRVVYAEGKSEYLMNIQEKITDLLCSENIGIDRKKFSIHATLCRVKNIKSKQMFASFINSCQNSFQTTEYNVESIVLQECS